MDRSKVQQKESLNKESQENQNKKKPKLTQEEELSKIQIKSIEKECLDRVYIMLCELRNF